MFGHQNDQSDGQDNNIPEESIHGVLNDQPGGVTQPTGAPAPGAPATDAATAPPISDHAWQHPGVPIDGADQSQAPISDVISPVGGFPRSATEQANTAGDSLIDNTPQPPLPVGPGPVDDTDDSATHELIDIKQHALNELSPLIDQLDLAPEERFRTLMMMIQASDDEHLVKAAYEAAHGIDDEKARARALLDIVNEVNYFTQQPEN